MTLFNSTRTFQIWGYHVSHARLLLRSPMSEKEDTNCDIVFYGFEHINMPTIFQGIEIRYAADINSDLNGPNDFDPTPVFDLMTSSTNYRIVAVACKVFRNQLDSFDSGLDAPTLERPRADLGEVVSHS